MGTTWALVRFYWGYGALVGLLWAVCRMAVGKVKSHENSTVSRNRAIGIKRASSVTRFETQVDPFAAPQAIFL